MVTPATTLPPELWQRILAQDPSNATALSQVSQQFRAITRNYVDHITTKMEQEHLKMTYIGIFSNNPDPEIKAAAATAILRATQTFYDPQLPQLFQLGLQLNRIDFLEACFYRLGQSALESQLNTFWSAMEEQPNLAEQLLEVDWLPWPFTELIQADYGSFNGLINLSRNSSRDEVVAAVTACVNSAGGNLERINDYRQSGIVKLLEYAMLLDLPEAVIALKKTYFEVAGPTQPNRGLINSPYAEAFDSDHLAVASRSNDLDLVMLLTAYKYIQPVQQAWALIQQGLSLKTYYPVFYATAKAQQWSPLLGLLAGGSIELSSSQVNPGNNLDLILDDLVYLLPSYDQTFIAHSNWTVALAQAVAAKGFNIKVSPNLDQADLAQVDIPNWPSLTVTGDLANWLAENHYINLLDYCLLLEKLTLNPEDRSYPVDSFKLLKGYYLDAELVVQIINLALQDNSERPKIAWANLLDTAIFLWRGSDPTDLARVWTGLEQTRLPGQINPRYYLNWWLAAMSVGDDQLANHFIELSRQNGYVPEYREQLGLAYRCRQIWAVGAVNGVNTNLLALVPLEILPRADKLDFARDYGLVELIAGL